jgi:hypothetical protein
VNLLTQLRERTAPASPKAYCETDSWPFDPRDTGGVCPICGWKPDPGSVRTRPVPAWMLQARRVPWDLVSLGALVVVLVALGLVVARASGI